MAAPEEHTFPATSGTVIGWTGVTACGLLLITTLIHDRDRTGLRWGLVLVLAALLIFAFMLRPRIRVTGEAVVLVNPLVDVSIPLVAVTAFEVRQATMVFVGSRRYVGVAVGHTIRHLVRGQDRAPGVPPGLGRLAGAGPSAPAASTSGRNLTIELLEERIRAGRRDARDRGETPVDADGASGVQRRPVWWLIGSIAVAGLALVVSLVA